MLFETALMSVQRCEDPQHVVISSVSAVCFQASGWNKF